MSPNVKIILLATADLIAVLLAVPTAYVLRAGRIPTAIDLLKLGVLQSFVFLLTLLLTAFLVETSNRKLDLGFKGIGAKVMVSVMFSFIVLSSLMYPSRFFKFGNGVLVVVIIFYGVYRFLCHATYRIFAERSGLATRILIFGTGPLASNIGRLLLSSQSNYYLAGYVKSSDEKDLVPAEKILNLTDGLCVTALRERCQKIVVSLSERRGRLPLKEVMTCKINGIDVVDAPTFYEQLTGKLLLENITPSWFVFSEGFHAFSRLRLAKRVLDILFATFGLIITLPFFPIVALSIKLDSIGPVFFRQKRVGQGEKTFTLYKFRTMRVDAEGGIGATWATDNDPRITRVGRYLRHCRIDELPQLFNVLKGDMSLIGPRPERQEFVEKLREIIPYYSERHYVKPGVTGWAQVRYNYGASAEDAIEKLRYDLYYIKNISLVFDLVIIFETIGVVLFGRGSR